MARFRPVSKFQSLTVAQQRSVFAGTRNGFSRKIQATLFQLGSVIAALTGSLTYPTPPVSLVDMGTAHDALQAALNAWGPVGNHGSKAQHSTMLDAYNLCVKILAQTAGYVQGIAQADNTNFDAQWATMLSSALAPRREKRNNLTLETIGRVARANRTPSAPANFRSPYSKHTTSGQTRLRWGKVKGATAYEVWALLIVSSLPTPTRLATVTATTYVDNPGTGVGRDYWVFSIGENLTRSGSSQILKAHGSPIA